MRFLGYFREQKSIACRALCERRKFKARLSLEPLENRELLATAILTPNPSAVQVASTATSLVPSIALDPTTPQRMSGPSTITNVNRPSFIGIAPPFSVVNVVALRLDVSPSLRINLGQAFANNIGNWWLNSTTIPDGVYNVSATITDPQTGPTAPYLASLTSLIVDTSAPRVSGLSYDARSGLITIVFQDSGSGLDRDTLLNFANYTLVPKRALVGANPSRSGKPPVIALNPATAGFFSNAFGSTIQFGPAQKLPPGRYTIEVMSGGVRDLAGNPLDGAFFGKFPSGTGHPGSNFVADLIVTKPAPLGRAQAIQASVFIL